MGRTTNYIRRKRDSKCFNPLTWDKVDSIEMCTCTEENFECDTQFYRDLSGACLKVDKTKISYEPPETCDGHYEVS